MQRIIQFYLSILSVCATLNLSSPANAQFDDSTQVYLPLQIGNTWNFRLALPDTETATPFKVFDTTRVDSKLYYQFGEHEEYPYLVRADSLGRIWRMTDQGELIWLDTTLEDSAEYEVSFSFEERPFKVLVRRNLTMETFAGEFKNCIEFFFDLPESFDEEHWLAFAPNIGIVRVQYDGFLTKLLTSATINGEIVTEVKKSFEQPSQYSLKQNYPNPFNPVTRIVYEIPELSYIKLAIYNLRGQEIRTLIRKTQPRGLYEIQWDGRNNKGVLVSSGAYIYRISTPQGSLARKLLFIK